MKLDNISNLSDKEFIKYCIQDENVKIRVESLLDSLKELEEEIESERKRIEILSEQITFRDEFIEFVMKKCNESGSKKDLVKQIKLALDNSYIEL